MSAGRARLVGWTLALIGIAVFARLGVWQLHRAGQKQAMLDAAARVLTERRAVGLDAAATPGRADALDWAAGRGRFADQPPLLLDNQLRAGRPGVRLYRVFVPERGTPLLVDLGWLPVAGDRALPRVEPAPAGPIRVRGLLAPAPSTGLRVGPGMARTASGWLLVRVDPAAVQAALHLPALAPRVLRLDPALPIGHERDLQLLANTLTPEQHRGYAVQWFGLAATVLVTALVLTFRKAARNGATRP